MRRALPLLAALLVLGLAPVRGPIAPAPALAQLSGGGPRAPQAQGSQRPPPPALPGLAGRRAPEPIPADPQAANLGPTAALFDGIARGDTAAVRDAVARGAELDARNVLGLTPLESAVDQGRQEIVFYLLAVRGAVRPPQGPPPEATAPAAAAPAAARAALGPAAARPAPPSPPSPAAERRTPRLFAGDGGTPIPEVGFLGFDAGRPAGAEPPAEARRPASGATPQRRRAAARAGRL